MLSINPMLICTVRHIEIKKGDYLIIRIRLERLSLELLRN